MKRVKRYDYAPNAAAKTETTREGFLKVMARATRTGVLKYKREDGSTIRELRHPDEVFSPESMETLALKPVTNNHPSSLLDSETASMHSVGSTGETVKAVDNKYLEVMTVITDKETIQDAEGGKVQVSPGYTCELDFTPGVFDGEEYDAIQRNIRYNHLAVVKRGRSGPEVCLRLDADDAIQDDLNQTKEKKPMGKKMKLGGKDYEMEDDLHTAVKDALDEARKPSEEMDSLKKDAKDAKADKEKAEKDKDKAEAKADGLEAEIKKIKKERLDGALDSTQIRKLVKERAALEKVAEAAGVEKFDSLDDIELKKAVIKVDSPDFNFEGKSEDYINARFDVAAEATTASDAKAKALGKKLTDGGRENETMDADTARQKMIDRQRGQWKNKNKEEEN